MKGIMQTLNLRHLSYFCTLSSFILSFVVLVSWHLDITYFVQWHKDFVPMQYNTALTGVLCSFALFSLLLDRPRLRILGAISSSLAFLLTFFIGLQYILGKDLGIDSFFVDPLSQSQSKTVYPGRMAPNTVLCFILLSSAILLRIFVHNEKTRRQAVLLSGLVCAFSLTALVGYLFNIEAAYGWWSLSNMAPQTALVILSLSVAMAAKVSYSSPTRADLSFKELQIPILVALVGVILTVIVAQSILMQGHNDSIKYTKSEALRISDIVKQLFTNRFREIVGVQKRWSLQNSASHNVLKAEASFFVTQYDSFPGVALVDKNFTITDKFSHFEGDIFWKDYDLDKERLLSSVRKKELFLSRLKRPGEIDQLLLISIPLYTGNSHDGFFLVAYDLERDLLETLKTDVGDFHYEIKDSVGLIASNYSSEQAYTWETSHTIPVLIQGMRFDIIFHLNATQYQSGDLVFLIFISGICLSVLFANVIYKNNELLRAGKKIALSEDRYSLAVDGACVALWDWNIEKEEVLWQGRAWDIFGFDNNSQIPIAESSVRERIPPEDNESINSVIYSELERGDRFTVEFRFRQNSGRIIWLQSRGRVVERKNGKPYRVVGIFSDVTERRVAEDLLRRTNEELEQFAYIASHDLKAPLRGIDNLAKWLEEDLEPVLTEDTREKMTMLRSRVSRLEMLLEDILRFSRVGRNQDNLVEVDVGDIIRKISEDGSIPETFKVRINTPMPTLISFQTPLQQVFMNLISNAVKHHDRTEGVITINAVEHISYYEFIVCDDGPGILPEFHERIFKMFQTLRPRDEKEGSGLGLAIVKKLVEGQGGRVWVASDGIRGTQFHFMWPKNIQTSKGKRSES